MSQTGRIEIPASPRGPSGRCIIVGHAPLRRVVMADRYFVDSPIEGAQARLAGSEAHHLAHVMRAGPGDLVTLFDGSGAEFAARVESVGRADVELAVLARNQVDGELPLPLVLGVAWPKGDRGRWLVEKATELGVTRLVPLATERGGEHQSAAGFEKLGRAVIEASKQCGRNRLMDIGQPQTLADFLTVVPPDHLRLIAQPGAAPFNTIVDELPTRSSGGIAIAVGPEGGFAPAEVEAAIGAGWHPLGLGPRTLRIETAALALAAALVARLEGRAPDADSGS